MSNDQENNEESSFNGLLNLDLIKQNISQFSGEKLCEMIVCDRYFGFEKKISSICMTELANRRSNGDPFDFEAKIESFTKEMPVVKDNIEGIDLKKLLQRAIKMGK